MVARVAAEIEIGVDEARHQLGRRGRDRGPARVVPYRSFGNGERVRVRGRVVHGVAPPPATPRDRWWMNLVNTYRRLETDEVRGARVRVDFESAGTAAITDDEGHFTAEVRLATPPPDHQLWHDALIDLEDPPGDAAAAPVMVPQRARFGVISDLDDTVLRTDARNLLRMGREVLFGNVHTRIPFPGVGTFYQALHEGAGAGANPIFYVSSSPWNLYDLLAEFLRLHDVPAGPMELRDWGLSRAELLPTGHRDHKRKAIDVILDMYPSLPFILLGDSGQEDPEIYREIVHDRPGRVLGVYIRSVVAEPLRIEEVGKLADEIAEAHADTGSGGPELILVEDTLAAARHAADRGWIDPAAVAEVGRHRAAEG